MCIIAGCDYLKNISGIGIKRAKIDGIGIRDIQGQI
jgi:hypothetical protein